MKKMKENQFTENKVAGVFVIVFFGVLGILGMLEIVFAAFYKIYALIAVVLFFECCIAVMFYIDFRFFLSKVEVDESGIRRIAFGKVREANTWEDIKYIYCNPNAAFPRDQLIVFARWEMPDIFLTGRPSQKSRKAVLYSAYYTKEKETLLMKYVPDSVCVCCPDGKGGCIQQQGWNTPMAVLQPDRKDKNSVK